MTQTWLHECAATQLTAAVPARVVEAVRDPRDDTTWIRLSCSAHACDALTVLNAYGLGARDREDGRLHVTGWDVRLLWPRG